MPKHDLPDGRESDGNLIDFVAHMRRRAERPPAPADPEPQAQETYRLAEYGDGRKPRFSRYDLLWLGMIAAIGYIFWMVVLR